MAKKETPMGRPRSKTPMWKRVNIPMTFSDYAIVVKRAKVAGLSIAEYGRRKVLK